MPNVLVADLFHCFIIFHSLIPPCKVLHLLYCPTDFIVHQTNVTSEMSPLVWASYGYTLIYMENVLEPLPGSTKLSCILYHTVLP